MGKFRSVCDCCEGEQEGVFVLPRRSFLLGAGALAMSGFQVALNQAWATPAGDVYRDFWLKPRAISLYRKQTGERGVIEYWRDGRLVPDGWYALMHLFRDVSQGKAMQYDQRVVDLVWAAQEWVRLDTGKLHTFRCTDGARLPETNKKTLGASSSSTHMKGMALDGRLEGLDLSVYARAALFFGVGGVGLYKTHVHVDSGPVLGKSGKRRVWRS